MRHANVTFKTRGRFEVPVISKDRMDGKHTKGVHKGLKGSVESRGKVDNNILKEI